MPSEYRPAPELVRAHEQLTRALADEARKAQTTTNLRGTEVMARLLPILDGILGFTAGVQADVVAYAEHISGESQAEVLFGLDADTFEDLDAQFTVVQRLLTGVLELGGDGKGQIREAMDSIEAVRAALSELVLDEDEEEEGDDEPLVVEG